MFPSAHFDFAKALKEGGLALHFQPRVSGTTLQILGAEALLRWNSGGKNWVSVGSTSHLSATDFSALWTWKLAQLDKAFSAIKAVQADPDIYPDFTISLNLSPKQLYSDDWASQLLETIANAGVPGRAVEIELSDHGKNLNSTFVDYSFETLRLAGVLISIDEFPGSCGLESLARHRFDKVRVENSMLPTTRDPVSVWSRKKKLLAEMIAALRNFGTEVALKGVEQKYQFDFLRELPIVEWQGYYWGGVTELYKLLPKLTGTRMHEELQSDARLST